MKRSCSRFSLNNLLFLGSLNSLLRMVSTLGCAFYPEVVLLILSWYLYSEVSSCLKYPIHLLVNRFKTLSTLIGFQSVEPKDSCIIFVTSVNCLWTMLSEILVSFLAIFIYKGGHLLFQGDIPVDIGDQSRHWGSSRTSTPVLSNPWVLYLLLNYARWNPWIRLSSFFLKGGIDMSDIILLNMHLLYAVKF